MHLLTHCCCLNMSQTQSQAERDVCSGSWTFHTTLVSILGFCPTSTIQPVYGLGQFTLFLPASAMPLQNGDEEAEFSRWGAVRKLSTFTFGKHVEMHRWKMLHGSAKSLYLLMSKYQDILTHHTIGAIEKPVDSPLSLCIALLVFRIIVLVSISLSPLPLHL